MTTLEDWDRRLPSVLSGQGPVFVDIPMERGASHTEDLGRLYNPAFRDEFRRALKDSK